MSGEDYCKRCIHKNVCHTVAECLNSWQDNFSCNDFEPERPTGVWIFDGHNSTDTDEIYCCSICCEKLHTTVDKLFMYCPNCGAKMKGDSEE